MIREAYGDEFLSRATIFRWHHSFANGRVDTMPRPKSGRPMSAISEILRDTVFTLSAEDVCTWKF